MTPEKTTHRKPLPASLIFFICVISLLSLVQVPAWPQLEQNGVQDADGNWYDVAAIGNQYWMTQNLRVTRYPDSTEIPFVDSQSNWDTLSLHDKGYCYYQNDSATHAQDRGALYTWGAALNIELTGSLAGKVQGICPDGWHIPSNDEWEQLANFVNGDNGGEYIKKENTWQYVGGHLKAKDGWGGVSYSGTDDYGFSGVPTGSRDTSGVFSAELHYANYWTASASNDTTAWQRALYYKNNDLYALNPYKNNGYAVRCIKDTNIFEPIRIIVDTILDESEEGGDGAVYISVKGGAKPYTYAWSNGAESQDLEKAGAGFYTLTITDSVYTTITKEFSIIKHCGDTVMDYSGNTYPTVAIGNQCWLAANMKAGNYANGEPIKRVFSNWKTLDDYDKAYAYYDYDDSSKYDGKAGAYYSWAAALNADTLKAFGDTLVQGICPYGWHIADYSEWKQLAEFINKDKYDGEHTMKKPHWPYIAKNLKDGQYGWVGGTNDYGFTIVNSGFYQGSSFNHNGCLYWFFERAKPNYFFALQIKKGQENIYFPYDISPDNGYNVRCVRNKGIFEPMDISFDAIHHVTVFDSNDASVRISVHGGAPPYNYSWSHGDSTQSIKNLVAGTYTVTITDSIYNTLVDSIKIYEPVGIASQPDAQTICKGQAVSFGITPTQTARPPFSYQWYKDGQVMPGDTLDTLTIMDAAIVDEATYNCMVSNDTSSYLSDSADLKVIALDVDAGENQQFCIKEYAQLQANTLSNHPEASGTAQYAWQPASGLNDTLAADPKAFPGKSTTYHVTATDSKGCSATDSVFLFVQNVNQKENICIVTVDPKTGNNMVVWEKMPGYGTISYKIYKKQLGVFQEIGDLAFDSTTVFVDENSEHESHAEIYKITALDTCMNEAELDSTEAHTTIFLQWNNNTAEGVNLGWSPYKINNIEHEFLYYILYRGNDSIALAPFDTIDAQLDRYTDKSPEALQNKYFYRIAGVKSSDCYADANLKASGGPYSRSVSNLEDNRLKENDNVNGINHTMPWLSIHPNPAKRYTQLSYSLAATANVHIKVYNSLGLLIKDYKHTKQPAGRYEQKIVLSEPGVYVVKVCVDAAQINKKLIIK